MKILMSISIYVQCVAIAAFLGTVHSSYQSCIGERCFILTGSNETKYFYDAKNWCKDRDSNLAVVDDENTQKALTQFLNSAQPSEQPKLPMFIDLKLYTKDRTWYLVNGTKYLGGLKEQRENDYWLYGYMKAYSSNLNTFYMFASKPNSPRNFICEFEITRCTNYSTNYYLYNGRCFVKFENETLTWYKARERCHSDLATFNYPAGTPNWPEEIPFNTSWLNQSLSYWVGVRWCDWSWKSSEGDGDEVIYSVWSSDKPNNIKYECVCVNPSVNPAWEWTDCSCTDQRQFLCLKIVPTTIAITTTTTPPTTLSLNTGSFPFANVTSSPLNALAIGLGAGIGGGVFLILLIIIIVVAVTLTRKRRRKNNGVESRHKVENTTTTTTTNIELTTPNGPDVYAQIVPTAQHPANNKPPNEVIYEQPEFSNNQNSASSGSDPTNLRQGRVQSIMLEGSSDLYANATSAS